MAGVSSGEEARAPHAVSAHAHRRVPRGTAAWTATPTRCYAALEDDSGQGSGWAMLWKLQADLFPSYGALPWACGWSCMIADRGTGAADLFDQRQTGCETGPGWGSTRGTLCIYLVDRDQGH